MREQAVLEAAQEHDGELETLGRVQRHHLHAVFPRFRLALAGLEHRVRQERGQRRHVAVLRLEAARRAHEFLEVLEAGLALVGLVALVMTREAARLDHVVHLLVQRQALRVRVELLDEREEGLQARRGLGAELVGARRRRTPQRKLVRLRMCAQHLERARTDAARRQVHDSIERRVVVPVGDQAQVGESVLDLLALEEPQAAVDAVRDARREQVFLEHARLRVRAVENRRVAPVAAARDPVADLVHDEFRLVALVVGAIEPDRLALAAFGPELLADAAAVHGDDRVRGREDRAGRAVVLLEPAELHAREVAAELLQVLDPRAAPAVDGLVVVADHERDAGRADQRLHPRILDRVGVLELVDQHVAETRPVVIDQPRHVLPQLVAAQQQLGEVHHAVAAARVLVCLVQADHLAPRGVAVVLQVLRAQPLVLLRVDEPRHLARHPARLVEAEAPDDPLHQPLLVLGVEDLEALRQAGLAPVHAQQPVRDAVERTDPERRRRNAELLLDAATHLARRLVGERHGEDAVRRHVLDLDQPGHAMREHARLAAAGAGEHEHRRERGRDGLALRVVQGVEEVGDVHGRARSLGTFSLSVQPSSAVGTRGHSPEGECPLSTASTGRRGSRPPRRSRRPPSRTRAPRRRAAACSVSARTGT